jgi:hypothetical protein
VENQQPLLRNMEVTWASGSRNIVRTYVIESTLADITKIICLEQNKIWGKQENGIMNIYIDLCHVRAHKSSNPSLLIVE